MIDPISKSERQSYGTLLMVRPIRFAYNPETAPTNAFQSEADVSQNVAEHEFDQFAAILRDAGLRVIVCPAATEHTPDALFPNNWVSFHSDGTVVVYPMLTPSRRAEVRHDIIEYLHSIGAFPVQRLIDLTHLGSRGDFLEGTGSVVLDRVHRIAYAALSPRTTVGALNEFSRAMDYEIVMFNAQGPDGNPIYHTNVMLAVGTEFAVICADSIANLGERRRVEERLRESGHDLVFVSKEQMARFAGNMIEVTSDDGNRYVVMSRRAGESLTKAQRHQLNRYATILEAPLETIESVGGGSARCMIAEVASV